MPNTLRTNAEMRLKAGTAPTSRGWTTGTQALTLLHRLASAPESASDALKLLHELQVHQVEIDLQNEQAEENGRQMAGDLLSYTALFELAPFAYLTLDREGRVIAANRSAAAWLSPQPGEDQALAGRRVEDLLAPACGAAVRHSLGALLQGEGLQSCAVQSKAEGPIATAELTSTPGGERLLMAWVPTGPGPDPATTGR